MTDTDRFRKLEDLFHELSALPEADRRDRLDEVRRVDPELAEELSGLLAHAPERTQETTATQAPSAAPIPSEIGPYRVIGTLGEGGMGVVYVAEQTEPVRRRVALKLVRTALSGRDVLARFEAERQVLARMSHSGIAQVYDAGTTEDGRSFVAMELVDGEPITTYCDRHGLDLRQRLELFIETCRAVQHAHQKGVIHRDLKPSNILVCVDEGRHLPKIIDFGIARALSDEPSESQTRLTRLGEIVGTLEYMSPEQTRGDGNVDTRSDVYALGVVLYELIAGVLPLSTRELLASGLDAVRRYIQETEPARPSLRVATDPVISASAAECRRTNPATLARALRGDLDWITLRALDKDPERRYASVLALAADIERHLNDEPVEAGPPSARYRLVKLVRRHRTAATASLAVLLAIVVGAAGTTVGFFRASSSARLARAAEARAVHDAEAAKRVSEFLVDVFKGAAPEQVRGGTVSARDLLDRGADRLDSELSIEPVIRARLLATVGDVYRTLGELGQARERLEEALRLAEEHLAPTDPYLLDIVHPLAITCDLMEDFERAEALYLRAIALAESAAPALDERQHTVEHSLGNLYLRTRRLEEATVLFERALSSAEQHHGSDHASVGSVLIGLGTAHNDAGQLDLAQEAYERALRILEREHGEDHPEVGIVLNNLAVNASRLGDIAAADAYFMRSLELTERLYGPDHPRTAQRYLNLSARRRAAAEHDAAISAAERALEVFRAALPANHTLIQVALRHLGSCQLRAGQLEAARSSVEAAYQLAKGEPVTSEGSVALQAALTLAFLDRLEGQPERAAARCREALAMPQASGGSPSLELELALALFAAGQTEAATSTARSALEAMEVQGGSEIDLGLGRARVAAAEGDVDRAIAALNAAVAAGLPDLWIVRDHPDLQTLRAHPEWSSLVERVRGRIVGGKASSS